MSNLRYYIAIAIAVFVFLMYWFKEDPSIYYERSVQDLSKIQLGKELAIKGRGEIKACISCHTQDITNSNYPRLAGLNPVYIKKQLKDFAKDKKTSGARYDEVMSPIAKAMNKDEQDFTEINEVMKEMGEVFPAYKGLSFFRIGPHGLSLNGKASG